MNQHIIESLNSNKLILFIGSGLSIPLGFPNWNELIMKILEELSQEEEKYKVLISGLEHGMLDTFEVLNKIYNKKREVYEVLDKTFDISLDTLDLLLHKKLGKISPKIITTNYDRLIESATGFRKIVFDNTFHLAKLTEKENFVLKLHGCIDDPKKCILFEQDYGELYKENAAIDRMRSLISDHTILFIGFSLTDEYVKKQFEYINRIYEGFSKQHYYITADNSSEEISGVKPIKLDHYNQLDTYFEQLITIKEKSLQTSSTIESFISTSIISEKKEKVTSIAILVASPIDKDDTYNFDTILKKFDKYKVDISCYFFSIETIRNLGRFDYIFIFTKKTKNNILIEDQYFTSSQTTIREIEENLIIEDLKGLFIFVDKELSIETKGSSLPLSIIWDNDMSSLLFKLFKRKSLDFTDKSIVINSSSFDLIEFEKGRPNISYANKNNKSKLPDGIDPKNLINFVGRKTDLEDITRKILDSSNSILTIKGSGGIGKTSTMKRVAIEFYERGYFPDGIFFIDCEFVNNYQLFEFKIAKCFDIDSSINIKEHIQENDLHIDSLIILDNFEPLLYIEEFESIQNLLTFICEYCCVVITSREWVDLEFERKHELRAFTNEEALQLFTKYYKYNESVENTKILKEEILDKLLNNNPLAIKIMIKNIPKSKSMSLLKDELEADFFSITESGYNDIFEGKSDSNIERSKSLYQSISYSYNKLLPNEKLLFETISLFPDGIHMSNIKTFFKQENYRFDSKRITDKEINALDNKSLIEINKGFIKLQSIIGRFSEHQFLKMSEDNKIEFYKRAFDFILYIIDSVEVLFSENNLYSLIILELNIENCLKSLEYMTLYEENKLEKLMFTARLSNWFRALEIESYLYPKIDKIKGYFVGIDRADMLLDVLIISGRYYEGDFDDSHKQLEKLMPIEKMYHLDKSDPLQRKIINNLLSVYEYSNFRGMLKYVIDNDFISSGAIYKALFNLGEYEKLIKLKPEIDFFYFDLKFNLDILYESELNIYIDSLSMKQQRELMQVSYVKAKMGKLDKKTVNNLVVTSKYTSGVKSLMLAFMEYDLTKAQSYYESAIKDLYPIRYYYTEAIYYYSKFLLDNNFEESEKWLKKGLSLAEENCYRVLIHKYNSLTSGIKETYDESLIELPDDVILDKLIDKINISTGKISN